MSEPELRASEKADGIEAVKCFRSTAKFGKLSCGFLGRIPA
jgi:hypothetical protein